MRPLGVISPRFPDRTMKRDPATTERLRKVISQIENRTQIGELRWQRQAGSAHRYARWNNNLLILGPALPISDTNVPRYLVITPFDSPDYVEINSADPELGQKITALVAQVETVTKDSPATDPFGITEQLLERIESM